MIAEREIEERMKSLFAASLEAAGVTGVRFEGAWSVAAAGEVKGVADDSAVSAALAVGIRNYATFQTPQADLPCVLAVCVRRDACPTGAELAAVIEPIMNRLHVWNADADAVFTELTTAHFSPGGFQLTGGSGPDYDETTAAWTVTFNFTLRGVIEHSTTTT